MTNFLERHGALAILTLLVLLGLSGTFYLGLRTHMDPDKVFAFFAGFTMGVFSALTLAMRGASSAPPPTDNGGKT